jgi:hypothetical protein
MLTMTVPDDVEYGLLKLHFYLQFPPLLDLIVWALFWE